MKHFLGLTLVIAMLRFGATGATAQIVTNGNFTANAALFSGSGYISQFNGQTKNPAAISDFAFSGTGKVGLGGTATGESLPDQEAPYGYPASGDPSAFAFLQGTCTLTQSINLTVGVTYTLSCEHAPRNGTGTLTGTNVEISAGSLLLTELVITEPTGTADPLPDFTTSAITFTVLPGVLGLPGAPVVASLTVNNGSLGFNTEDYSAISVVPEPSAWAFALVGTGGLVGWTLRRRYLRA